MKLIVVKLPDIGDRALRHLLVLSACIGDIHRTWTDRRGIFLQLKQFKDTLLVALELRIEDTELSQRDSEVTPCRWRQRQVSPHLHCHIKVVHASLVGVVAQKVLPLEVPHINQVVLAHDLDNALLVHHLRSHLQQVRANNRQGAGGNTRSGSED